MAIITSRRTRVRNIAPEIEQSNRDDGLQTPSGARVQKQGMLARRASRENTSLQPFAARFAVINLIGVALIGAA
jgi:hypothetical protein